MDPGQDKIGALNARLVARIGLSVAALAAAGLLLVLALLSDDRAGGYGQAVGAFGTARQSLGPAMLAFGLATAGLAGIAAWLFSLYASFRIAGPLYRIARNLEQQLAHDTAPLVPIRADDELQAHWREFADGAAALRAQRERLRQALAEVALAPGADNPAGAAQQLHSAIGHLREIEQRVRL